MICRATCTRTPICFTPTHNHASINSRGYKIKWAQYECRRSGRAVRFADRRVRSGERADERTVRSRSHDATPLLYQRPPRPPPPPAASAARRPLSGIRTSEAPRDAVQCTCDRSRPRTYCRATRSHQLITQYSPSPTAWTFPKQLPSVPKSFTPYLELGKLVLKVLTPC